MVFTKREKAIIAATIAALCLLVLDLYVLTPLLEKRAAAKESQARLVAELEQASSILERSRLLRPKWQRMLADGMQRDPAEAEAQLLRCLRDWADQAGVELSSLRPERSVEPSELPEVVVHSAGTGSMEAVSRLLWRVETAGIPVKIKMLQLGSRKDGTDDLSLHLKLSTLCLPPSGELPEQAGRERTAGRGDQ